MYCVAPSNIRESCDRSGVAHKLNFAHDFLAPLNLHHFASNHPLFFITKFHHFIISPATTLFSSSTKFHHFIISSPTRFIISSGWRNFIISSATPLVFIHKISSFHQYNIGWLRQLTLVQIFRTCAAHSHQRHPSAL